MKAMISGEGFPSSESFKLEPYLWVGEYFARLWQRNVIFDAPHSELHRYQTDDEDSCVHVHFFSHPYAPDSNSQLGYAQVLYGISVPSMGLSIIGEGRYARVSGDDTAARFRHNSVGSTIRSPENRAVAQVVGNHIFILFDLAHRKWDGAVPVLWEILQEASRLLYFLKKDEKSFPQPLSMDARLAAHHYARGLLLQNNARVASPGQEVAPLLYRSHFKAVATRHLDGERKILVADTEKYERLSAVEEQSFLERCMRHEVISGVIASGVAKDLSSSAVGEQFDTLLENELVWGVRVQEDKLHVYTHPIPFVSAGETFYMSQYHIVIEGGNTERASNTFKGLRIGESGWRGPFRHPEANIQGTYGNTPLPPCFGATFALSVQKALVDQEFLALASLMIHYLASDSRSPNHQSSVSTPEPYVVQPFYADENDKQKERSKWIAFVQKYQGGMREKTLLGEQKELGDAMERHLATLAQMRSNLHLLRFKKEVVDHALGSILLQQEYEAILSLDAVSAVQVSEDFLWVSFGPGSGFGSFTGMWFDGSFSVLIGRDKIFTLCGERRPTEATTILDRHPHAPDIITLKHKVGTSIVLGRIGDAVKTIYEVLRGFPLSGKYEEQVEVTEEVLRDYLKRFVARESVV